jgi:hypothetical protein
VHEVVDDNSNPYRNIENDENKLGLCRWMFNHKWKNKCRRGQVFLIF